MNPTAPLSKSLSSTETQASDIAERTGIPATTAVLALNQMLALRGITRLGLVTPYTADVQQRIVANYAALGVEVVAERHLGIRVNHDFALVEPARRATLIAKRDDAGTWHLPIHLGGPKETVFFDV